MNLDPLRRRALLNGGIAATVTFVIGLGVVMAVSADDAEPPPVSESPSPTASATPACEPTWAITASADPGDLSNWLSGVTALSGAEAWAVGASGDPDAPASVLIERWDGTTWTAEEGPAPGTQINELRAVDAAEPNDVWAVGRSSSGFGDRPMVLRYDGTTWLDLELPSEVSGVLNGIAAIAPNDVWVVGSSGDPDASLEHALVLHWDGQLWAVVDPGRAVGQGVSALVDVQALASDDVWAVGYLHNKPLIVHFDGTEWTRSETDVTGRTDAIRPITPTDVWAVGSPIQRFDGTRWTQGFDTPGDTELLGVAALGPEDVWAVGRRSAGADRTRSLVLRFDGQAWSVVLGAGIPGSDVLEGVDALADGTIFAVGVKDVEAGRRTVAIQGTTCPAEA